MANKAGVDKLHSLVADATSKVCMSPATTLISKC